MTFRAGKINCDEEGLSENVRPSLNLEEQQQNGMAFKEQFQDIRPEKYNKAWIKKKKKKPSQELLEREGQDRKGCGLRGEEHAAPGCQSDSPAGS